jgi:DNA polymerase III delta prime subunit
MHAHLITGSSEDYILNITSKKFFFPLKKVNDLKELKDFTKLQLTEETAIIIQDFDEATEETQNAFLKLLEEPQKKISFIITAKNIDNVLPTIVSRCEVIEIQSSKLEFSEDDREKYNNFIDTKVGNKLSIISKINKREEGINFIKNLIFIAHESLKENPSLILFLENATKTLKALEANGNVQLQLTNFVVKISF